MRGHREAGISPAVIGLGLVMLPILSSPAAAATAPILSKTMAQDTNDLQRAVWACEAGAPVLAPKQPGGIKPRFFLGVVDSAAGLRTDSPLTLRAGRLSGRGQVSTGTGWSNIRFDCVLSPGLDQARSFTFDTVSPVKASSQQPPSSSETPANGRMIWHVDDGDPLMLAHGVPETDDQDFSARCTARSGSIVITMARTVTGLRVGDYVTVGISAGPKSGLYVGRGVLDEEAGMVVPAVTIGNDPLIGWMAARDGLLVNIGQETVYTVSLSGSAAAVRTFENGCGRVASNPVAS